MVGTCNGLLCLQEYWKDIIGVSYSTITVINPITNEKLVLPLSLTSWSWEKLRDHGKYSFGYHPITGKYKVVHIPWAPRRVVEVVRVFTLGDASWRHVPVNIPGTTYQVSSGAVSIDGWTYWLTEVTDRVMAMDLDHESVISIHVPQAKRPPPIPADAGWQLTNVHARLGLVVMDLNVTTRVTRAEVWMLDGRADQQPQWSKRYNLLVEDRRMERWITAPHLTHGESILRKASDEIEDMFHPWAGRNRLFRHNVDLNNGHQLPLEGTELIMSEEELSGELATFEYVETLDPIA